MDLVRKDNNNNVRVARAELEIQDNYAVIKRSTGLLYGTMTAQPDIDILAGKANRTIEEQGQLEFNSIILDYMDKGYKSVHHYGINSILGMTDPIIKKILSEKLSDANAVPKPMLAKTAFNKYDQRFNKVWYGSYKIDGVRCTMRYDQAARKVLTASRGGKDFDVTTKHITENPAFLDLFRANPELVLDGELYIHGKSLQFLQGLAKLKYYDPNINLHLDFYIFDVVCDKPFSERMAILDQTQMHFGELASIYQDFAILGHVRFVDHVALRGYSAVEDYHREAIADGYEGLVLRDPDALYGYGSRDWRMIKIKMFEDAEFKIIGMEPGLRPEDMVFVLLAPNGRTFEAKPMGIRSVREAYGDNIVDYIGKMATVKYFGYTRGGVPNLPIMKYIREVL